MRSAEDDLSLGAVLFTARHDPKRSTTRGAAAWTCRIERVNGQQGNATVP